MQKKVTIKRNVISAIETDHMMLLNLFYNCQVPLEYIVTEDEEL